MYIGIKNGKVVDICSDLINANIGIFTDSEDDYIEMKEEEFYQLRMEIGDSWDFENNINVPDSPKRSEPQPKSRLELLEEKMIELESKIIELERK